MSRYCLLACLVAVALVLPLGAHASTDAHGLPAPLRLSPEPGDERHTLLTLDRDGQPLVAWVRRDERGQVATLYVIRAPYRHAIPIVSRPFTTTFSVSWVVPVDDVPQLLWSTSDADAPIIHRYALGVGATSQWQRKLPEPRAFAVDGAGQVHYAWTDGSSLRYEIEPETRVPGTGVMARRYPIAAGTMADEISLAVDAQGVAHIAWVCLDGMGQRCGVYHASTEGSSEPLRVSPTGHGLLMVADVSDTVHLAWRSGEGLYYVSSGAWRQPRLIARDVDPDVPASLAVGPDGTAYVAWVDRGLWWACSLDWRASQTRVADVAQASGVDLAVGPSGRVHIAWSVPGQSGGTFYLAPLGISPQFRITFPLGDTIVSHDQVVRAESNVGARDVQRVAFYLQCADTPGDAPTWPLIELGIDQDGRDGWEAPLQVEHLDPESHCRVMLLATDSRGQTIPMWGEWFRAQPADQPLIWVTGARPGTDDGVAAALGPVRGRARLEGALPVSVSGDPAGREITAWDLHLAPEPAATYSDAPISPAGLWSEAFFVGTYHLPWSGEGARFEGISALNGEPYYSGLILGKQVSAPGNTPEDDRFVRSGMYGSFLSGGLAGHIYGAQGLWGGDVEQDADVLQWDALRWSSANFMQHLRTFAFCEGTRYRELVPDSDLVSPNKSGLPLAYEGWAFCARTPARDLFLIYFEKGNEPGYLRGTRHDAAYAATWFDPRQGQWIDAGEWRSDELECIDLPALPTDDDWALKLKLKTSH